MGSLFREDEQKKRRPNDKDGEKREGGREAGNGRAIEGHLYGPGFWGLPFSSLLDGETTWLSVPVMDEQFALKGSQYLGGTRSTLRSHFV
jgi:hypothetical protein